MLAVSDNCVRAFRGDGETSASSSGCGCRGDGSCDHRWCGRIMSGLVRVGDGGSGRTTVEWTETPESLRACWENIVAMIGLTELCAWSSRCGRVVCGSGRANVYCRDGVMMAR